MSRRSRRPRLRGVIFDLDGTLVDSRLDFDLMRKEIGISGRQPVLEYVENLPEGEEKKKCWEILLRHELEGAKAACLIPGVVELLDVLSDLKLHQGVLTRNSRGPTELTLERLAPQNFSQVLTREDAPPKPDPTGLLLICQAWECDPESVIFVGDYRFDILAGKRAGMKTVLYTTNERPIYVDEADYTTNCFLEFSSGFETVTSQLGFSIKD